MTRKTMYIIDIQLLNAINSNTIIQLVQEAQLSQRPRDARVVKNFAKLLKSFNVTRNYTDKQSVCKVLLLIRCIGLIVSK